MARFTGGGSLDVAVLDLPPGVASVTTTGGNYYEADAAGTFRFTGAGRTGEIMSGIIKRDRQEADAERAAIEAASKPRGCNSCGRMFADPSAYVVHRDPGWPGGCLPGDALGQLVDIDGVLCRIGSAAAGG
jgi:hypothetical protein